MPPDMVNGHENCCSVWTVSWAAQPRLTDNAWFDVPLVAGSDGAAPLEGGADLAEGGVDLVEGAARVEGAEGARDAWLATGPEGAGAVDGPGDFAWPVPGLAAALCRSVFDAAVGVIATSADGLAPAACWPLRLA